MVLLLWLCIAVLLQLKGGSSTLQMDVHQLARQMMLQQLFVEERIRSDGDSGIKQVIINI